MPSYVVRTLAGIAIGAGILGSAIFAQDDSATLEELRKQISVLEHPSYRARERAIWQLTRRPKLSLTVLRSAIESANQQTGPSMVDLLTEFALQGDVNVSLEALEILRETSEQVTSVGRLAKNSLSAIADLQEKQAIEIMLHHSAEIGERQFSLNGSKGRNFDRALHINERFTGDDETIRWIPFLKSIDTVCLEGPNITRKHLEAVTKMKGIRNLKLKSVKLNREDFQLLRRFSSLEHLGLLYVDISDADIDLLRELPVSNTMKISGTQITKDGYERLKSYLDDVDFYFGRGGFLGVGPPPTNPTSTIIGRLIPGSSAEAAGLKLQDKVLSVNSVEVNSFTELRLELGEYKADEEIELKVMRGEQELTIKAKLKEES